MHPDRLSRQSIAPGVPQQVATPAPTGADAGTPTKPEAIDWGPSFDSEHFTQIPNGVFNLVLQKRLIPFDLVTYGYFLGRAGAMEAMRKAHYTWVPEAQTASDLNRGVRTIRASVARLLTENLIERQDTPGFTRTRVLVKVKGKKVVQRPRIFPPTTTRKRIKSAVPPACPAPRILQPATPPQEGDEMPF